MVCCRELRMAGEAASPFNEIIALDYYDGIRAGLAACTHCGSEFRFENLDDDEGGPVRVVSFAPLPQGSMKKWVESVWERPSPSGIWVPIWSWPDSITESRKDRECDAICELAEAPRWVAAWRVSEPMIVLRWHPWPALQADRDWFEFCDVKRQRQR